MKLVGLIILQGLLEMTGTVGLSLVLARTQFSWKKIFLVGSGLFVVLQIARHLPLFFGFHTLVGLLALTVYLVRGERASLANSFVAAFFSLLVLGLLEFAVHAIVFSLLRVDPKAAIENAKEWALIGLPQGPMMILLAWAASKILKPRRVGVQNELPRFK
jgi:hypothetical protein